MNKQNRYQRAFYNQVIDLSLNMRIELPYEDVLNVAEAVNGYNEFTYARLKEMLERFDEIIPRQYYNEGNPNNGERVYKLSIGREGSMVVYMNLRGFGHGNALESMRAINKNRRELERIAREIGKADEFDINYYRKGDAGYEVEIRIWWD